MIMVLLLAIDTCPYTWQDNVKLVERQEDQLDVEFLFWNRNQEMTWSWPDLRYIETPESIQFNEADDPTELNARLDELSGFNKGGKTVIIIHGFTEDGRKEWIRKMKDALIWNGKTTQHHINNICICYQ